jgi:hypothetical protein
MPDYLDPFELSTPDWEKYFGNNHHRLPRVDVTCGGGVYFKNHLGKPLSHQLWQDLIHRFTITGLCIYKPNDLQWTLDWGDGHCLIYLDDKDNVRDIYIVPHKR